jgi:hypothetical protein
LTGGEDCSMRGFFDVFQDLGFCGTGVTKEEDIDVSTDGMFAVDIFWNTTEEG